MRVLLILGAIVSCSASPAFVYVAREYTAASDCLGPEQALDVLGGDEPARTCAVCLTRGSADAGDAGTPRVTFASTMCPPVPPDFALVGDGDEACVRAIASLKREALCLPDGGSSNPLPVVTDAGAD